jgi:hypothetical protein
VLLEELSGAELRARDRIGAIGEPKRQLELIPPRRSHQASLTDRPCRVSPGCRPAEQ